MSIVHFVLGLFMLGLGGAAIVLRTRIVARHARTRRRGVMPATVWMVFGVFFIVDGLLQLILSLLS